MKRNLSKLLVLLIVLMNFITIPAHAVPSCEAQGIVLLDGYTGEVLYSKNPNVQFEPASTTKVMTALVTLEHTNLDDKVTIGDYPPFADGSSLGIRTGEVYTVRELLYGLLLSSANDCADALAQHVAGSNAEFAKLMNKKAKDLGAKDTEFKNPSGLHESGHVTTAYDLALIMQAAAHNTDFVTLARHEAYFYKDQPYTDGTERWAINMNMPLNQYSKYYYKYLYCGKNGYTPEANHSYTAAAVKDDQMLIASFLNSENKDSLYSNVGATFDYGFNNFKTSKIVKKGDVVSEYKLNDEVTIPLLSDSDVYYTTGINDPVPEVNVKHDDLDVAARTITMGEELCKAKVMIDGKNKETIHLTSGIDREYNLKVSAEECVTSIWENKPLVIGIIATFILSIVLIVVFVRNRNSIHNFIKFNLIDKLKLKLKK